MASWPCAMPPRPWPSSCPTTRASGSARWRRWRAECRSSSARGRPWASCSEKRRSWWIRAIRRTWLRPSRGSLPITRFGRTWSSAGARSRSGFRGARRLHEREGYSRRRRGRGRPRYGRERGRGTGTGTGVRWATHGDGNGYGNVCLQPACRRVLFAAPRRHAGCIDLRFLPFSSLRGPLPRGSLRESREGAAPRKEITMASNAAEINPVAVSLDADRLEVYRVAREFDVFASRVLPRRGCASLRDQFARASSSIVLNIAEGCGRYARPEKAHFYLIARGSAMECAAILDVALGRGMIAAAAHRHGRGLLGRVVQMLTRLALRMQA